MHAAPTVAAVQPVVLALAPPTRSATRTPVPPCLEVLGGATLVERLLTTLAAASLRTPIVVAPADTARQLAALLGDRGEVLACDAGRVSALDVARRATDAQLLLIHDAERALTPLAVIEEVLTAAGEGVDAVVPALALTDSVKAVDPGGLRNIDRTTLVGVQSPRLLRRELLEEILVARADAARTGDRAPRGGVPHETEDEVLAALDLGARVRTVHGSHAGFAVVDRLSLWQAQISLGLARDTSHRVGLSRRS